MATKIFDVTLRIAIPEREGLADPGDWRWDWILSRVVGEDGTVLKVAQAPVTLESWIEQKGPALVLAEGTREHLAEVWAFAEKIDKTPRLLRALDQAALPTFFGRPSQTVLMIEKPYSFYFEIYGRGTPWPLRAPRQFAMNGGVIFHTGWAKCPADGTWIANNGECPHCGKRNTSGDSSTEHRSIENKTGDWSVHT